MTVITPEIILRAYAAGIFPMAESAEDPTLHWVEPEERGTLPLDKFHVSHSLRKVVKRNTFDIRIDNNFKAVIAACAASNDSRPTTWINQPIRELYTKLHKMGHAHSVEAWADGKLVGGLYGLQLGAAFFGESMFSRRTNASKVALVHLVARLRHGGFTLLDAQFMNHHLVQFGAVPLNKAMYQRALRSARNREADFSRFSADCDGPTVLALASTG